MGVDLLYPNEEAKAKKLTNTAFYDELGFNQALYFGNLKIFGSINEENHILDYFTYDEETIKYRLDIFDDFVSSKSFRKAFERIMPRLSELIDLKEQRKSENDVAAHLFSLSEMDTYFTAMKSLDEVLQGVKGDIKSRGLLNLADFIHETVSSAEYNDLKSKLAAANEDIKSAKSVTIGVNLDAQLRPIEAGIVSVNSDVYKSGNLIDKVLRLDLKDDGYFCTTPLDTVTKNMAAEDISSFYESVNHALESIFKTAIKSWTPMVKQFIAYNTEYIVDIVEQLQFYIAGVSMFEKLKSMGLKVCRPSIQAVDDDECRFSGLYNPMFVLRESTRGSICNNIVFDQFGKLYVLTGATKSGKSVFAYAIGIAQAMFQLGMYVPAEAARMSPVENIFAFCPRLNVIDKNKTKVEEEAAKIGALVKDFAPHTMVVIDDAFECASNVEADYLLTQIVEASCSMGVRGVISSSFSDIADKADSINEKYPSGIKVDTLIARTELGKPTYIIDRERPEGADFAQNLAEKYGIGPQ